MSNIVVKKLKCGVNCVFEVNDFVQSVAFGIFVKVGSINEHPKEYGISHVIEHMFFKGTNKLSAKQIAEATEKIGAQVNAYTSYENTCFHVKAIKDYIYNASDVLFDMLNESLFSQAELDRERNVILEEMKMTEDDPAELCHENVSSLIFKDTPYEHPIIGNTNTVKSFNSDHLKSYVNNQYTKDSIVISVCGNFDINEMTNYLEDKFYNIKESKEKLIFEIPNYLPSKKIIKKDIEQSHICIANRGAINDSNEKYQLSILSEVLGGGMSSRLFQNIREQKGLCYNIFSMNQSYSKIGLFEIYGGVSHENVNKFIDAVNNEMINFKTNNITIDEFNKAKIQLKSGVIYSSENILSTMFINGKSFVNNGRVISRDEMIERINNVQIDEVNDLALDLLNFDKFSISIVTK